MNRHLLLILLTSWSLLVTYSDECDTGVAFPNNVLSVTRSSLANADVALLKSYVADTVIKCMEDCCTGKYGACSVASFKKNTTNSNCLHFYCRPLKQCKFLSSPTTDSFTFSSDPFASHPVPSSHAVNVSTSPPTTPPQAKSHFEQPHAVEEIATFSKEQADLKNDNKGVKPRKGVTAFTPDALLPKSGIKPRKGVTIEDVPHSKYLLGSSSKSNVKPRKGVGIYSLNNEASNGAEKLSNNISSNNDSLLTKYNSSDDVSPNDLDSMLARVFEDDPLAASADYSSTLPITMTSKFYTISPTPSSHVYSTSRVEHHTISKIESSFSTFSSPAAPELSDRSSTTYLHSSSESASDVNMLTATKVIPSSEASSSPVTAPLFSAKAHISMKEPPTANPEELENSKKYTSSIHLILSLVFGLIVLLSVLGVVAKRIYDGWQRRDYYRMNYLIDGIYNGYD